MLFRSPSVLSGVLLRRLALRLRELTPIVVADAIGSRRNHDREIALAEMRADRVVVSTVEAVLFEMMGSSDHKNFKEVQSLVK